MIRTEEGKYKIWFKGECGGMVEEGQLYLSLQRYFQADWYFELAKWISLTSLRPRCIWLSMAAHPYLVQNPVYKSQPAS